MKVKLIKTKIERFDKRIANADIRDSIEIGAVYWVYGISITELATYIFIYWDDRHLRQVPLELFEIVDDKIPPTWHIRQRANSTIDLFPIEFHDEYFLENFAEWEKKERRQFEEIRKLIEI